MKGSHAFPNPANPSFLSILALGVFGIFSSSSALLAFSEGCVSKISKDTSIPLEVTYGPSFWMTLTGVIIKLITVIFHILIPVPRELAPNGIDTKYDGLDSRSSIEVEQPLKLNDRVYSDEDVKISLQVQQAPKTQPVRFSEDN